MSEQTGDGHRPGARPDGAGARTSRTSAWRGRGMSPNTGPNTGPSTGPSTGQDDRCGIAVSPVADSTMGFSGIDQGVMPFLPDRPGLVLTIGAGSLRDAAWFAARGWTVLATAPAGAMRDQAMRACPAGAIRWVADSLPELAAMHRLGLECDLIRLGEDWAKLPQADRPRAMRKLATLLKPGGRLIVTLRHRPAPHHDGAISPVNMNEVERLGLDTGLALRAATNQAGRQAADGIGSQILVLDLPEDGAGALPLLRGIILKQEKNATYKLALLRCLARIADASPNVARDAGEHVELPLGLVALYWLRMFKPLVAAGLPQRPDGRLGFVRDGFRAVEAVPAGDCRPGAMFAGAAGHAMRQALAESARLIADMPATHLSYADDSPVFPTVYGRMPPSSPTFAMDQPTLWSYGVTRVPIALWTALRRMAAWIEPMLVAEWVRLTQGYAANRGMVVSTDQVMAALRWIDPDRDTGLVRDLARGALARGQKIHCVWSGKALTPAAFDIDHCLPWSAWPCGDLWNLLPASPAVNRHGKRQRIVCGDTLAAARPLIQSWWQTAYLDAGGGLSARFAGEVQTTLPLSRTSPPDLDDVFQALDFRRLRLRQDTQLAEWHGVR